jgi:hypothetical protein
MMRNAPLGGSFSTVQPADACPRIVHRPSEAAQAFVIGDDL